MKPVICMLIALCGMGLSSCATVVEGANQAIAITTPPTGGANCVLTGRAGSWSVVTPGVTRVSKSKENILVHCTKPGWQDATASIPSDFQGWTIGNVVVGGLVGFGVDAASGAINQYPDAFQVPMTPLAGTIVDGSSSMSASLPSNAQPRVDTSGVNMQPAYPATALYLKESGSALVEATVRDDGKVKKVFLQKSSGYGDLDSAAVNAVMNWKFLPAMEYGRPVSGQTIVQITFQPPSGP